MIVEMNIRWGVENNRAILSSNLDSFSLNSVDPFLISFLRIFIKSVTWMDRITSFQWWSRCAEFFALCRGWKQGGIVTCSVIGQPFARLQMDLRTNTPISGRLNRCSNAETREEERKKREHALVYIVFAHTHTHTHTRGDLRQWAAIKVINGHESFTILILSSRIRNNKVLLRSPSPPCSFHFVYDTFSLSLPSLREVPSMGHFWYHWNLWILRNLN